MTLRSRRDVVAAALIWVTSLPNHLAKNVGASAVAERLTSMPPLTVVETGGVRTGFLMASLPGGRFARERPIGGVRGI